MSATRLSPSVRDSAPSGGALLHAIATYLRRRLEGVVHVRATFHRPPFAVFPPRKSLPRITPVPVVGPDPSLTASPPTSSLPSRRTAALGAARAPVAYVRETTTACRARGESSAFPAVLASRASVAGRRLAQTSRAPPRRVTHTRRAPVRASWSDKPSSAAPSSDDEARDSRRAARLAGTEWGATPVPPMPPIPPLFSVILLRAANNRRKTRRRTAGGSSPRRRKWSNRHRGLRGEAFRRARGGKVMVTRHRRRESSGHKQKRKVSLLCNRRIKRHIRVPQMAPRPR